ncbi:unnamed protein product [Chrysoparadoxa australica]
MLPHQEKWSTCQLVLTLQSGAISLGRIVLDWRALKSRVMESPATYDICSYEAIGLEGKLVQLTCRFCSSVTAGQEEPHHWRVLPALLSFQLGLHALLPDRPVQPFSVTDKNNITSQERLHLIVAGFRCIPPLMAAYFPSLQYVLSWGGKEWSLPVSRTSEDMFLLDLPRDQTIRTGTQLQIKCVAGSNAETIGHANVDWEGLSCLPRYSSNYLVDALGSWDQLRTMKHRELRLQLAAPNTNTDRFNASSSVARLSGVEVRLLARVERSTLVVPHYVRIGPMKVSRLPGRFAKPAELELGHFRSPNSTVRYPFIKVAWALDDDDSRRAGQDRWSTTPSSPWDSKGSATWDQCAPGRNMLMPLPQQLAQAANELGSWPGSSVASSGAMAAKRHVICRLDLHDMGPYCYWEHDAAILLQCWARQIIARQKACEVQHLREVIRHQEASVLKAQSLIRRFLTRCKFTRLLFSHNEIVHAATLVQRVYKARKERLLAQEKATALRLERLRLEQEAEEERLAELEARRPYLMLQIISGRGLKAMDITGTSDPFCKIIWNGELLKETKVSHHTCNPVWVDEIVELPMLVPEYPWGVGHWPQMDLRIEVLDYDLVGDSDPIGELRLSADDLLPHVKMVSRLDEDSSSLCTGLPTASLDGSLDTWDKIQALPMQTFFLLESSDGSGTKQMTPFDNHGSLGISLISQISLPLSLRAYSEITSRPVGEQAAEEALHELWIRLGEAMAQRECGLWVPSASGLMKADLFGKADPYTVVYWDGEEIGRTKVKKNTLDPRWISARSTKPKAKKGKKVETAEDDDKEPYFSIPPAKSRCPKLRLEVYDWEAMGSHDFLGGIELSIDDMVELQRKTLKKSKLERSQDQLLLQTDFPLEPMRAGMKVQGTIGLCLYLDQEAAKKRRQREVAAAAKRQAGQDAAEAEHDNAIAAEETILMEAEDVNVGVSDAEIDASWEEFLDEESGASYYFNSTLNKTQWDPPQGYGALSTAVSGLEGWEQVWSNQDQCYYWSNAATGEASWEQPTSLLCLEAEQERDNGQHLTFFYNERGNRVFHYA